MVENPDILAGAAKRLPHPPVAVGVVVGRMQLADDAEQPFVQAALQDTDRRVAESKPVAPSFGTSCSNVS